MNTDKTKNLCSFSSVFIGVYRWLTLLLFSLVRRLRRGRWSPCPSRGSTMNGKLGCVLAAEMVLLAVGFPR
jgi:hypothetical protein